MVAHVRACSRTAVYAFPETLLEPAQLIRLEALLQRRCDGEPLAYLTGEREFWSLPLFSAPGSLVPRPETEQLVELAVSLQGSLAAGCIVELGTGSGAIALALAQEISERTIIAVERYPDALRTAMVNVQRFGHGRVQLLQGNWLDSIAGNTAALVIANPPYLASDDPHLPGLRHEPHTALVSGDSGLEDLEQIISDTRRVGRQGCLLLLEHGHMQGKPVRALLRHYNYQDISTHYDLAGFERVSLGTWTDSTS